MDLHLSVCCPLSRPGRKRHPASSRPWRSARREPHSCSTCPYQSHDIMKLASWLLREKKKHTLVCAKRLPASARVPSLCWTGNLKAIRWRRRWAVERRRGPEGWAPCWIRATPRRLASKAKTRNAPTLERWDREYAISIWPVFQSKIFILQIQWRRRKGPITNKLNESLNFWKMSMYSASLGGRALIDSIPSPCSFFFDFRDLI